MRCCGAACQHPQRDVEAINRIYRQRKMVPLTESDVFAPVPLKEVIYLVAEDVRGRIVGSVMGD